jgi:hypothetical protein
LRRAGLPALAAAGQELTYSYGYGYWETLLKAMKTSRLFQASTSTAPAGTATQGAGASEVLAQVQAAAGGQQEADGSGDGVAQQEEQQQQQGQARQQQQQQQQQEGEGEGSVGEAAAPAPALAAQQQQQEQQQQGLPSVAAPSGSTWGTNTSAHRGQEACSRPMGEAWFKAALESYEAKASFPLGCCLSARPGGRTGGGRVGGGQCASCRQRCPCSAAPLQRCAQKQWSQRSPPSDPQPRHRRLLPPPPSPLAAGAQAGGQAPCRPPGKEPPQLRGAGPGRQPRAAQHLPRLLAGAVPETEGAPV